MHPYRSFFDLYTVQLSSTFGKPQHVYALTKAKTKTTIDLCAIILHTTLHIHLQTEKKRNNDRRNCIHIDQGILFFLYALPSHTTTHTCIITTRTHTKWQKEEETRIDVTASILIQRKTSFFDVTHIQRRNKTNLSTYMHPYREHSFFVNWTISTISHMHYFFPHTSTYTNCETIHRSSTYMQPYRGEIRIRIKIITSIFVPTRR